MIQRGSHTSLEEMKGRRQKALMGLSRGLCSDDSVVKVAACSQRGDEAVTVGGDKRAIKR